ncbi:MAG: GreA/GreB family elongation factor [candidate division WOR-3 bacterium]
MIEEENFSSKNLLSLLEKEAGNRVEIRKVLPFLMEVLKEKEGENSAFNFLKILSEEKYKFKFQEEEILQYFEEIFKERAKPYLNSFKKELKKDIWKYLNLIEKLLLYKAGDKVFYNKKKGIIEDIDFEDRKFKIKMEDGSTLEMAFILCPDKLEIIEREAVKEKDRYFKEPFLFIEKMKEEKYGIPFDFFKAKGEEVFGLDFEKWLSLITEKTGFLILKKDKQYIKFFKDYASLEEFLKRLERVEVFSSIEKNIKYLKVFREKILYFFEKYIKPEEIEEVLNFIRIKNKLEGKTLPDFKELLSSYSPMEIYKNLRSREEKEAFIEEIKDNEFLKNILLFEEDLKISERVLKKLFSKENIGTLISISDKNPALFIVLFNFLEGENLEEAILVHKKYFLYKLLNSLTDPSFSKLKNHLQGLWARDLTLFILKNSAEEIEELAGIIEERKEEEGFPYSALKAKIESLYPGVFEEKKREIYCVRESFMKKEGELKKILEEIPQVRKMITQARELGDLRENFEYKSARERYEFLQSMVYKLKEELKRAKIVKKEEINSRETGFGTKVYLKDREGKERVIQILGPWESNPEEDIFSCEAEAIKRIIGKYAGEEVELFGEKYKIERIEISDLL